MATSTSANLWRTSYTIDRARIAVAAPLRGFLAAVVILSAGMALGVTELAIAAAIGALFAGVLDLGEPYPMRMRAMLWSTLWCATAAFAGTLVSQNVALHVVIAGVVAIIGGFAGALGMHGGLIGLVSLVVFVIFSGTPAPSTGSGLGDGLAVGLGGLLATGLAICAWPLRRFGGTRSSVAAAYRTLALSWQPGSGVNATSPAVAAAVVRAGDLVERSHLTGAAGGWLQQLVAQAESIRLTLLALSPTPQSRQSASPAADEPDGGHRDANTELATAASRLVMAISRALAWEPSRRRIGPAAEGLAQQVAALPPATDSRQRHLTETLGQQLGDVATSVAAPWPRAQHGTVGGSLAPLSVRVRIAAHWHLGDIFVGHAVRLAVAIMLATGLAAALNRPHSYWIPLTVAWLAKPDLAGTVTRIPARVLGTVAGVALVALVVFPLSAPWWLIWWSGVGAAIVLSFLWANYAVAVAGVTTFVLAAFALTGSDERSDALERVVYTLIAAALVFVIALVRPRRSGRQIEGLLADTCAAMNDYAVAIRDGTAGTPQRARVLKARSATATALAAAAVEPHGRRPPEALDPEVANEMLGDLVEATAALLTEELLTEEGIDDPEIWAVFDEQIARLEGELRALTNAAIPAPTASTEDAHRVAQHEHPIHTPVRRARARLHGR